jgi:(2Fe-2S) ferredoxin
MSPPYQHHIFVCLNERDPSDPRGACKSRGGDLVIEAFRREIETRGLQGKVRANKAGCLGICASGPNVVIYPEGVWYVRVQANDVKEIVDAMVNGVRVERLLE